MQQPPPPVPPGPRQTLARLRTEGYAGYSLAYSPFFPATLAVASSANFGLVGNGRLHVNALDPKANPFGNKVFDTQDGLFDLAWSEVHENQLATASGDGSIKLWDVALNNHPIRHWHEHSREIFCIDWGNIRKDQFATCSWDHTIKLWTPERPDSVATINAHDACVYASLFSPHSPDTIASCSSDGLLKVWDLRTAPASASAVPGSSVSASPSKPALVIPAHPTEVLSLDWNKYRPDTIATASVDRTVRVHDLRMAASGTGAGGAGMMANSPVGGGQGTIATLVGHDYAIRRVAWSPHAADVIASSGYDMTARIWKVPAVSTQQPGPGVAMAPQLGGDLGGVCTDVYSDHKEFVVGLAWSLYEPGVLATASWDQECHIF